MCVFSILCCVVFVIEKNPSPTSTKDKVKLESINEGQPLPRELVFRIELGLNSHPLY